MVHATIVEDGGCSIAVSAHAYSGAPSTPTPTVAGQGSLDHVFGPVGTNGTNVTSATTDNVLKYVIGTPLHVVVTSRASDTEGAAQIVTASHGLLAGGDEAISTQRCSKVNDKVPSALCGLWQP